jgi:hypothetical protein
MGARPHDMSRVVDLNIEEAQEASRKCRGFFSFAGKYGRLQRNRAENLQHLMRLRSNRTVFQQAQDASGGTDPQQIAGGTGAEYDGGDESDRQRLLTGASPDFLDGAPFLTRVCFEA